jgi:hypothetical protein
MATIGVTHRMKRFFFLTRKNTTVLSTTGGCLFGGRLRLMGSFFLVADFFNGLGDEGSTRSRGSFTVCRSTNRRVCRRALGRVIWSTSRLPLSIPLFFSIYMTHDR